MVGLAAILRKGIDAAAHQAATSPINQKPLPTDAQRSAGNYPKGHHTISGLGISIENPVGSVRNPAWPTMSAHYGYITGTVGTDGDHVDVFVKPGCPDDYDGPVHVIGQNNEDGTFDEHKVMLGWDEQAAARRAYLNHYSHGWEDRIASLQTMTMPEFKEWLKPYATSTQKVRLAVLLRKRKYIARATPKQHDKHVKAVAEKLAEYLADQAKTLVPKIVAQYALPKKSLLHRALLKADEPVQPSEVAADATTEAITPAIDTSTWSLSGLAEAIGAILVPGITTAYVAAAGSAGTAVGISVNEPEDSIRVLNQRAQEYAEQRAGELIVDIDDATRNMVRSKVEQGIAEGWTSDKLFLELNESRAFSPQRAMTIAAYELGTALENGTLEGWKASGVVTGKKWITADDDLVSDDCRMNEEEGVIPLDATFPSGHTAPLAHPNCRCSLVAVTE